MCGPCPAPSARVVKLVDTRDLKSLDHRDHAGSIPAPGTILQFEGTAASCQEMTESSDPLAVQMARLEERMKTTQAEYKTDIARLAEDAAKRETRLILAMAGFIAVAVAILSFTD